MSSRPNPGRRWVVLGVIFVARTSMGYQFQSIGSVAPTLVEHLAIDFAMLGALVGLYKLPGVFLAYPGSLLGGRFGDKTFATIGMALMAVGGLVTAWSDDYAGAMAGRAIAGSGAVFFNVLSAKIIADWFVERELTLAMAVHVNSWPFGIALGLATQATITTSMSLNDMLLITAGACGLGTLLILGFCQTVGPIERATRRKAWLSKREFTMVSLAAMIWLLFNAGLIVVVSFAPAMLVSQGLTSEDAGRLASIGTWLGIVSIPVGGILVQKYLKADFFMTAMLIGGAAITMAIALFEESLTCFILFGMIAWAPAGAIVALPVQVVSATSRGIGMGVFFSYYYLGIGVFSPIAGWLRDVSSNPAAPIYFAASLMLAAWVFLVLFRIVERSGKSIAIATR